MSSPAPTLIVMAAGIGSRYGGLKQIDPVGPGGEAVLDYSVFDARRAGFGKFVFIIRKEIEKDFREIIGRRFERAVDPQYVFQELTMLPPGQSVPPGRTKPWGTGHAVLCAGQHLDRPCAVINADDFYGADAFGVLGRFLSQPPAAVSGRDTYGMVGYQLASTLSDHGTVARGVCRLDADGNLATVEELLAIVKVPGGARNKEPDGTFRPLTGREVASMNFWGFTPAIRPQLQRLFDQFLKTSRDNPKAEFYVPVSVNQLLREGAVQVRVLSTTATWFGITYREDRPLVTANIRALVRAGAYPERLWE